MRGRGAVAWRFAARVPARASGVRVFSSVHTRRAPAVRPAPPAASVALHAVPAAPTASLGPVASAPSGIAHARQLLRWLWLTPAQRAELESYVALADADATPPAWMEETYDVARSFRTARARRWMPTGADLAHVGADAEPAAWVEVRVAQLDAAPPASVSRDDWDAMDDDERADVALQPVWAAMPADAREAALVRVAFVCIRQLGWRAGYSSGYPGENADVDGLRATGAARTAARRALRRAEEARAWEAWAQLAPAERAEEWRASWAQRDRSMVYVDDAPTTQVLGSAAPRWFAVPQRAGALQFLPGLTVRLVRNFTRPGEPYDVWKATFRVPLNVHKHLLRSYLFAVYGLQTTWARSMVYRSKTSFDMRKMRKSAGRGGTYKKVEVGLLEPFVFPALTRDFLRSNLFTQEMMYEERRLMLRMSKGRRWRGTKSRRDLSRSLDRRHAAQNAGASDEAPADKPSAQLLVRSGSVPTARHGNILSVLAERRAAREQRVQQYVNEHGGGGGGDDGAAFDNGAVADESAGPEKRPSTETK
ncbi:hypothetical protein MSPP1_000944 [Malassezia sp. CBS 17886]|nr:hypothetical protein MSPP1_000944 [Malassezia sp. CBS 17886]